MTRRALISSSTTRLVRQLLLTWQPTDIGRRATRPGAHAAVVAYAEEALAGDAESTALANFDQMRRSRNRSEYGGVTLSAAQVKADLESARAIVDGVRKRGGAW
jgi:hypothetical protein